MTTIPTESELQWVEIDPHDDRRLVLLQHQQQQRRQFDLTT
jgi:hypothetical protein